MSEEIRNLFPKDMKYMDALPIINYIEQLQLENDYLKMNSPERNIEHFRILKENKRKIDNLKYQNKQLKEQRDLYKSAIDEIWDFIKTYPGIAQSGVITVRGILTKANIKESE